MLNNIDHKSNILISVIDVLIEHLKPMRNYSIDVGLKEVKNSCKEIVMLIDSMYTTGDENGK